MNGYQLVVILFALFVLALSLWAIVAVAKSPTVTRKPLWIIGSLCGFVGLGINWTAGDDLALVFGIVIPVIQVFKILPAGPVIIKTGFPFIALVALVKAYDV